MTTRDEGAPGGAQGAEEDGTVAPPAAAKTTPRQVEVDASGRTVEGQLVADFVDAAAGSASSGSRGSAAAIAAVPTSSAGAVPLTGVLAVALLGGGAAYEWRQQRKGRAR